MDDHGWTCLHYAVVGGSLPVMRYLVDQYGFDLSVRDVVSCAVVHYNTFYNKNLSSKSNRTKLWPCFIVFRLAGLMSSFIKLKTISNGILLSLN